MRTSKECHGESSQHPCRWRNDITCMCLLVAGGGNKNRLNKACPSPICWCKIVDFYALFMLPQTLAKAFFLFSFLETGNLRALILGGEKDLNTLVYLSIQRTSPSVASTSQEKVAFCACSLTMSMSAFTECDNPFSTESDALEQCLKKYVCVLTPLCVCVCLNCECNSAGISQSGLS